MNLNRTLVMVAGAIALIGLALNVAVDFDNVYDMTMAALWVLTLILAFAGAFWEARKLSMLHFLQPLRSDSAT